MLELTPFQQSAIDRVVAFSRVFRDYKTRLASAGLPTTTVGATTWTEVSNTTTAYSELVSSSGSSIPNCSVTIPTGGGKTIVGLSSAVELLLDCYKQDELNVIVWLVPNDAIYRQVVTAFSPGGLYFNTILGRYARRINLKQSSDSWLDTDLSSEDEITVLLLSKDSLVRDSKKKQSLVIYRNPDQVSGLSVLSDSKNNSLFALIQYLKPIFVIDEAHRIYTEIGQQFFKENEVASFILELTATPKAYDENHKPNVIFRADGNDLIAHKLIKKSIKYNATIGQDTTDLIKEVCGLQKKLEDKFKALGIYVIPRVLISVEFTGQKLSSETHSVAHLEAILENLGVAKEERVIKTSEKDQLKDRDLDDPSDPARYILTKTALVEGWDCKSVYIVVLLNNIGAQLTNTQIVGRGLRQPRTTYFSDESLNTLFLITNSTKHDQSIKEIKGYLFESGLSDIEIKRTVGISNKATQVSLLKDLRIHYVKFDRAIYSSTRIRSGLDLYYLTNRSKTTAAFEHSDVEHVKTSVDVGSGEVGALMFRPLKRTQITLSTDSISYSRLFRKLFFATRPYFYDSLKCAGFIKALLYSKLGEKLGAPEEVIAERCKNILTTMRQEYLDSRFTELLYDNSQLISDMLSKIFANSFTIQTGSDDTVTFENCLLSEVPSDFLNSEELEFARNLDNKGVNWLKTSPSFKIDFPYPLGTFYPDFLVVPSSGTNVPTIYIETKGTHLLMNEESKAKAFSCDIINQFSNGKLKMIFGSFEACEKALSEML